MAERQGLPQGSSSHGVSAGGKWGAAALSRLGPPVISSAASKGASEKYYVRARRAAGCKGWQNTHPHWGHLAELLSLRWMRRARRARDAQQHMPRRRRPRRKRVESKDAKHGLRRSACAWHCGHTWSKKVRGDCNRCMWRCSGCRACKQKGFGGSKPQPSCANLGPPGADAGRQAAPQQPLRAGTRLLCIGQRVRLSLDPKNSVDSVAGTRKLAKCATCAHYHPGMLACKQRLAQVVAG